MFTKQTKIIAITTLLLVGLLLSQSVSAVGISVGYPKPINLGAGENLYYGGVKASGDGNLILLETREDENVSGIEKFKIDLDGSIYIGEVLICSSNGCLASAGSSGDTDWTVFGNNMYSGVSGNVGIGTANPSQKLEINGNLFMSAPVSQIIMNSGSEGYTIFKTDAVTGNLEIDATNTINEGGDIILKGRGVEILRTDGATKNVFIANGLTVGGKNVCLADGTNCPVSAGGDADWTISGSNMYSGVGGNVGIGTSAPSQKLHVVGNALVTGQAAFNGAPLGGESGLAIVSARNGGDGAAIEGVDYDGGVAYGRGALGYWDGTYSIGVYGGQGGGSYAGYFDGDVKVTGEVAIGGKVSVGTSVAFPQMEVVGTATDVRLLISSSASNSQAELNLWSKGGATYYGVNMANNRGDFYIWMNKGGDKTPLYIDGQTGNISLTGELTVDRYINADGGVKVDGVIAINRYNEYHAAQDRDVDKYGTFHVYNGAGELGASFGSGDGDNLVVLSLQKANQLAILGGKVGIGTVVPVEQLEVVGSVPSGGDVRVLISAQGQNTRSELNLRATTGFTPVNVNMVNAQGDFYIWMNKGGAKIPLYIDGQTGKTTLSGDVTVVGVLDVEKIVNTSGSGNPILLQDNQGVKIVNGLDISGSIYDSADTVVSVNDNLDVSGRVFGNALETSGNIIANSNLRGTCAWQDVGASAEVFCDSNRYVAGVKTSTYGFGDARISQIYCCEL